MTDGDAKVDDGAPVAEAGRWGALSSLKILDFTQALSGPFCTQILADHGAQVLKIEPMDGGDITRSTGPFHPDDRDRKYSGYFQSINRNKKSMAIDLKSDKGREIIMEILPHFDVVVENFRLGVMDKLGLSYEAIRKRKPSIIYATVRGFGDSRSSESPYANWPAYDPVAQAMGGVSGVTGPDEDHPTKIGVSIGDIVPGLYLAIGVLAAVLKARETGHGQFVDVAMVDAVLAASERIVYQFHFGKKVAKAEGNRSPNLSPNGFFPAKDGHVAIAATTQRFFQDLCEALGCTELLADPDYMSFEGRATNRHRLTAQIENITSRYTKAELIRLLGGKVPFGPVYDMADIAEDEHFAVREMLPKVDYPEIHDTIRLAGVPVKLSETPGRIKHRAPLHGEHGAEFLMSAGFSEDEIRAYRAAHIIK
ncbi:CoA transferase [Sphingomonadaceae bacterium G21617-S1]|nr:CoA transferase [Sphingomonadaceae bacterium G21617-S1]